MVKYHENGLSWDKLTESERNEVVRAAAAGEESAFSFLASAFSGALAYLIASLGAPRGEREDLRQEGLMGLYKACHLFDPERASFSTFARLCMRSAVVDALRRTASEEAPTSPSDPVDAESDPQKILVVRARLERVLADMDTVLSPLERRVLLCRLRGQDSAAIADSLGVSVRSVDNALFRGRAKLKQVDMPE